MGKLQGKVYSAGLCLHSMYVGSYPKVKESEDISSVRINLKLIDYYVLATV